MPKVRWVVSYGFCKKISYAFRQYKKFEYQLTVDKVSESLKVGTFWDTVYTNYTVLMFKLHLSDLLWMCCKNLTNIVSQKGSHLYTLCNFVKS